MVLQLNTNKMNLNLKNIDFKYAQKAILCIVIGTVAGLFVYEIFLYFNIAIFGWNLGLIFAPLSAGYVETKLENRYIGKNLGAISAFILFIDTTIYSFVIKNPNLGINFITIGSVIIILQAAFPTVVNHILFVVLGSVLSTAIRKSKNIVKKLKYYFAKRPLGYWEGSNKKLNNTNFFFLTSSDIIHKKHTLIKHYQSEIILDKGKSNFGTDYEKTEKMTLMRIKEGKDECLIKLAQQIKNDGGNGIVDLSMNYSSVGFSNDIQIIAIGMGVFIE